MIADASYLAPEQWECEELEPATDQYSIAVLAYLLFCGALPYLGQESPGVRQENFRRGPVPVDERAKQNGRTNVPDRLWTTLSRALSLNPRDRFGNLSEFWKGLEAAFQIANVELQSEDRPLRVFVSYKRKLSSQWASRIGERLNGDPRWQAFVDTDAPKEPGPFPMRLKQEIDKCDVFFCLLGSTTLSSDWVREEIRIAHGLGKPMVPLFQGDYRRPKAEKLEPCMRDMLDFQGVHLYEPKEHFELAFKELVELICKIPKTGE